jgi:MFS family permease
MLKRNITLFYIVRATFIPFFWLPVLYIYLTQHKGLDVASTMFLLGLQELALIFLEIPTGVIADKISRRFSVALGYILTGLPFAFLPFVNNFYLIVVLFLIKAIGKALTSGADKSLLYDTLLDHNQESQYKVILNRANSIFLFVTAFCILAGGFIAQYWHIVHTLWLPLPIMLVGASAAMLMKEPESSKKGKQIQEENYFRHAWGALRYIFSKKSLLAGLVIFSLARSLAVNLKWFYTPIFSHFEVDLVKIGSFTFILYLLKSLAAYLGSKFSHKNNLVVLKIIDLILVASFLLGGIFLNKFVLFSLLLVILFSSEIFVTSAEEYLHQGLSSKDRATAFSIMSLFSSILATVMINGWGFFQELYDLRMALIFISIILGLGFFIFSILLRDKNVTS